MADFCTKCSHKIDPEKKPDIDVENIFENLQEGYVESGFICEGCGLVVISRQDGKLKVIRDLLDSDGVNTKNNEWEDY